MMSKQTKSFGNDKLLPFPHVFINIKGFYILAYYSD